MSKNRRDYEYNHEVIRKAYLELLTQHKRKPTLSELAKKAHVSIKTVDRHMEDLQFKPQTSSLRLLTDDILVSIFHSARKGNVAAQKLWLIVLEGWNEKTAQTSLDDLKEEYIFHSMSEEQIDDEVIIYLNRLLDYENSPKRKILLTQQIELQKQMALIKQKLKI